MFNRKIGTISKKIHTPYEGMFGLGGGKEYVKEVTGTRYIDLTYAVANELLELKAYGGTEQRNIPSGYTQVEYLEVVTSGVYFRTGINADINTEMEITASNISSSSAQLMVADCSSGMDYFRIAKASASQRIIGSVGSETVTDDNTAGINKFTAKVNKIGLYIDGTIIGAFTNPPSSFTDIGEIRIFAGKYSNAEYFAYNESKLYSAKIRQNGVLVGDYIPCRNSSNVLGLYDKVTNTFLTESGTGTFTAGADVVPTPATPMDIVCNNGVVKVRNKSGLPLGYQRVEYLQSSGNQYIDTGVPYKSSRIYNADFQYVVYPNGAKGSLGARQTPTAGEGTFDIGCNATLFYFYNNSTAANKREPRDLVRHAVEIDYTNSVIKFDGETLPWTSGTGAWQGTYNIYIGCENLVGTPNSDTGTIKWYSYKVYDNGVLFQNLIPAKRKSDNVLGMYDTVSQTFLTNAGTGTFTAGAIDDELEIYTDGTTETVELTGKNLFNVADLVYETNKYLDNSGVEQSYSGTNYTKIYIPVMPNTNYTVSGDFVGTGSYVTGIYYFDKNKAFISRGTSTATYPRTYTTPADCAYVDFQYRQDGNPNTWQLELGETATTYEAYYNGGTATAEMLLKIGDYKDVQSILDGAITRNVGIKVLDGTEDWSAKNQIGTDSYRFTLNVGASNDETEHSLCTHISRIINSSTKEQSNRPCIRFNEGSMHWYETNNTTTLAQFKQFLSDQYQNGTPVIIVYPLATPTTESVAGQTMNIQKGTNTIEITQASIDNLQLYAKYKSSKQ